MTSLIGYGGHGKDIAAIHQRHGGFGAPLFVYDENPKIGTSPDGITDTVIFGSNYPNTRKEMAQRFAHLCGARALVDPSAVIGSDVMLGEGVVVAPKAVILTSTALGNHVHINYGAMMTRCTVGDYSTIAPGATICGDVQIGEACYIGANATVCDRVTIGNNVTIAAGAIVPPLSVVPHGTKVIGVWKP